MANGFSKEEVVAFESLLTGFEDALVLSNAVNVYQTDQTTMERTNNVIWRPMPYIATTIDGTAGTDISATGFKDYTQLTVPSQINTTRTASFALTATELRDAMQEGRLYEAAKSKLASDINLAIMQTAALQGTLVVARTGAASGYDDVSQNDAIMNEQGVPMDSRYYGMSTRTYNGMANNLQALSRSFGNSKSDNAYERSLVGRVAGFDTLKFDYAVRLPAALGGAGLTLSTLVGAANYLVPAATTTSSNGLVKINVDNRYQTITVSSSAGVVAGDAFTIAGVNACHHVTKGDTGQLKTFRVISVPAGGITLVISPPIVSNQGASQAEAMYQNVIVTPAAAAAIVFLNKADADVNVFWHKDSLELLPGRLVVPSAAGVSTMQAATKNGLQITATKFFDINKNKELFRVDTLFGTVCKNPEMCGIQLFSQV
jgi:hypothetical protein